MISVFKYLLTAKIRNKKKNIKTAKTNNRAEIEFTIGINKVLYKIKYMIICKIAIMNIILLLGIFLSKRNLVKIISNNIWLKFSCELKISF